MGKLGKAASETGETGKGRLFMTTAASRHRLHPIPRNFEAAATLVSEAKDGVKRATAEATFSSIDIKSMADRIFLMTKTQIQVPEELFREIREFARQREWSLAETFRRGAELLLQVYPETTVPQATAWTPPTSNRVGWKGLSPAQLREAVFADADARLA